LENFPSIKMISGMDFSSNLFDQIMDLGAEFELEAVTGIEKIDGIFHVKTDYGEHLAKTVIIATGCKHRKLGLEDEARLTGKGISYCAVCDGAFYNGKDVLLIGDANTALQYAIMLSETCHKVTIVTLFDHFFADDILIKKLKEIENIEIHHNKNAIKFLGEAELTGVVFEDTETHETVQFDCDGCFIAIGQVPSNEPYADLVDLEKGFIVTDETMATKTPGLFAAGDCRVKGMRQVITATSDAAIAAMSAVSLLNK
nr:FAD-dependent oxidoreductase [Bacilli bacterium]